MYNFGIVLTFLFASLSPVETTQEVKEPIVIRASEDRVRMGREAVADVRIAYEKGEFDAFLKEMDADFLAAKESAQFEQFLEMRKAVAPSEQSSDWARLFEEWKEERNEKLLQSCKGKEDLLFCKKVTSISTPIPADQKQALKQLSAYRFMTPGSGKTAEENRLIDLDVEYEYKMIHADSANLLDPAPSEHRVQQEVLAMEHMDKLEKLASSNLEDPSLKKAIELAAMGQDERLAQIRDAFDLQTLTQRSPLDPTEKLLAAILESYQAKYSQLYQVLLNDQEEQ